MFASGARYDDPANSTRMGGYTLVDLRAGYAFSKGEEPISYLHSLKDDENGGD